MFESFIMNEPNPDVLEVKKTKLTRAIWVIIVVSLMLFILSPVFKANITWPQITALMYTLMDIIGSLEFHKLNQFPLAGKVLLGIVAIILALLPILIWTIKYMLTEQIFSFNSKKRAIAKNGRIIAKFDDINILRITKHGSLYNMSLIFNENRGLSSHKINFGLIFKWEEATEVGYKIAETIGVEVTKKGLLSENLLNRS